MTQEQHFDVAAYALGVLDANDATRFEDHLIDCPTCAIELESLVPVVDLLADIDADSIVATEQSRNDGLVLHKMIGEVTKERRRANSRRLYSLAAAVVVFAMLSVGALFAGSKWLPGQGPAQPSTQAQQQPSAGVLPPLEPEPGSGGPELPDETRGNKDSRTGVSLNYGLETTDLGTQITYQVGGVKADPGEKLLCSLWAKLPDGNEMQLATWNVGERGWGTDAQKTPLQAKMTTALPTSQIATLMVKAVGPEGGAPKLLVSAP